MYHHVAKARPGRLLFADAEEAAELWARLCQATPGLVAMCLMPNHVHLLHPKDVKIALGKALSGYTRWRNTRRGESGPLLGRSPEPRRIEGKDKIRLQIRYIHLNPCRARIVHDPVAWPFSTHLDAVGLALPPRRRPVHDPHGFHRYVSADGSVRVDGTLLPCPPTGLLRLEQVVRGVAAASRLPARAVIAAPSPARRLLIAAARGLTDSTAREIAATAGVSRRSVLRVKPVACSTIAALGADDRLLGWERAVSTPRRRRSA